MSSLERIKIANVVASNVKKWRIQSGLTVEGFASAISISVSYVRRIQNGKANITTGLGERITNFLQLDSDDLYKIKSPDLKQFDSIAPLKEFYISNERNPQFFINRQKENNLAHFLRTELLNDNFMNDEHDVGQIQIRCLEEHSRKFDSKELSRELGRLVDKGLLVKRDKFGNGTVFLYKIPG